MNNDTGGTAMMILMTDETAFVVRAIINGVIAMYALCVVALFGTYFLITADHPHRFRPSLPGWYRDPGVQAALAIVVYMLGVAIGAGSRWVEKLTVLADTTYWFGAMWVQYVVSGAFIVGGSMLILFGFSPVTDVRLRGWGVRMEMRWWILLVTTILSIAVPVLVTLWAAA